MTEEIKSNLSQEENPSPEDNQGERVDNRLAYEPPKLTKYDKVNGVTKTSAAFGFFDAAFGYSFSDFS